MNHLPEKNNCNNSLTKLQCVQELITRVGNKRNAFLFGGFLLLVLLSILIVLFITQHPVIIIIHILIFLFGFILCVICFIKAFFEIDDLKKIKNLDFYISLETCTNKYIKPKNAVTSERIFLVFSNGEKYKIDYSHKELGMDKANERKEYSEAYIGKKYYVFYLNSRKALWAIPFQSNKFDAKEFEHRNGFIYPVKTDKPFDLKEIIRQKSEEAYNNYTQDEKNIIEELNKIMKRSGKICITFSAVLALNIASVWFIMPICYKTPIAAILYFCIQITILILWGHCFFNTLFLEKRALDSASQDYSKAHSLKNKHNKRTLFLGFGLLIDSAFPVYLLFLLVGMLIKSFRN